MTLGERLKRLRERRGWSQVHVAKKLGFKRSSTYANYEYGIRDPDTDTMSRLAEIYETTTDYLINGDTKSVDDRPYDEITKHIKDHYPEVDINDPDVIKKLIKLIDVVFDDYEKKQ